MSLDVKKIVKIEAYKVDLVTYDEIRWEIYLQDGTVHTINEDSPEWETLTKECSALHGFASDWFGCVAYPAFRENRTIIYEYIT